MLLTFTNSYLEGHIGVVRDAHKPISDLGSQNSSRSLRMGGKQKRAISQDYSLGTLKTPLESVSKYSILLFRRILE